MLRDTEHGPLSLSKLLCFVFGAVIAYDMVCHTIGAANVAAFGLDMSAAFGRAMFGKWLDRQTVTSSFTTAANVQITNRRDQARGVEPT